MPAVSYREKLLAKAQEAARGTSTSSKQLATLVLSPNDSLRLRILTDTEHAPNFQSHSVQVDGKWREIICLSDFDRPCPMCADGVGRRNILNLIVFDYQAVGKEIEYNGKLYPENPLKIFKRTPGKNAVNHIELVDLDLEYAEDGGLCGRDFKLKRVGAGTDTIYNFTASPRQTDFQIPAGLGERHLQALEKVMELIRTDDVAGLIDMVLPCYKLPPGVEDYPQGRDHIDMPKLVNTPDDFT